MRTYRTDRKNITNNFTDNDPQILTLLSATASRNGLKPFACWKESTRAKSTIVPIILCKRKGVPGLEMDRNRQPFRFVKCIGIVVPFRRLIFCRLTFALFSECSTAFQDRFPADHLQSWDRTGAFAAPPIFSDRTRIRCTDSKAHCIETLGRCILIRVIYSVSVRVQKVGLYFDTASFIQNMRTTSSQYTKQKACANLIKAQFNLKTFPTERPCRLL